VSGQGAGGEERATFEAYGLTVAVEGWARVVAPIRLDFAWFEKPSAREPDVRVTVERGPPDFGRFGHLTAAFVTPRSTVYRRESSYVVDHVGAAVSEMAADGSLMEVRGEDEHILHDAVYYFLVGRFGRHVDAIGLPRVHGLGVAGSHGAVLVLLPPGGGKTTLALRALREEGVTVLSDDSPLLDREGRLHPFPLRFGVNVEDGAPGGGQARRIERLLRHPKLAVEVATFADRIATSPVPVRHVVVGARTLAPEGTLVQASRRTAIVPLIQEGVVGVGLYQGIGYAHQLGARAFAGKLATAAWRARCAGAALRRASVWQLRLGRNVESNWAALRPLLTGAGPPPQAVDGSP
jgi:hypothetical protein